VGTLRDARPDGTRRHADSIEPIALIAKGADALAVLLAFPPIPIEVRQKRAPRGREQFASDWRHRRHRDDHRLATERSAAGTPHAGLELIVGSPTPMGDTTAIRLNAIVGVTAR
jgi:hypothetical protein